MILAHGGHYAIFLFPLGAITFLLVFLKKDAPKNRSASTPAVPRTPWSRQVRAATRPPRPERSARKSKPVFAPPESFSPPETKGDVTPLQQPWLRSRRGA